MQVMSNNANGRIEYPARLRRAQCLSTRFAFASINNRNARSIFVDASEQKFYRDAEASTGTKLQEIEANAFAAELLMPQESIEDRVTETLTMLDEPMIERLAEEFSVSQSAMVFRLQKLRLLEHL